MQLSKRTSGKLTRQDGLTQQVQEHIAKYHSKLEVKVEPTQGRILQILTSTWNYHRPQNRYMPEKNCLGELIRAYITEGAPKKSVWGIHLGIGP